MRNLAPDVVRACLRWGRKLCLTLPGVGDHLQIALPIACKDFTICEQCPVPLTFPAENVVLNKVMQVKKLQHVDSIIYSVGIGYQKHALCSNQILCIPCGPEDEDDWLNSNHLRSWHDRDWVSIYFSVLVGCYDDGTWSQETEGWLPEVDARTGKVTWLSSFEQQL